MNRAVRLVSLRLVSLRLVAALLASLLVLTSCTGSDAPGPNPSTSTIPADDSVATLAAGLASGDLDQVRFTDSAFDATGELKVIMSGMDGLRPTVIPGAITYADGRATVELSQTYAMGGVVWEFTASASLVLDGDFWHVEWAPTLVHPDLTDTTRIRHEREVPKRASITGRNGLALVEERAVYQVGIDKSLVKADAWATSAKKLAALVDVDANTFAKQVAAAGEQAFVVAITMRQGEIPASLGTVPGARALEGSAMLAPNRLFARSILGSSGQASAEQVAGSKGGLIAGDVVGTSGLQARYDAQLRGTPGHTITQVARSGAGGGSGGGSATPIESPPAFVDTVLFQIDPVPGKPLATTLDLDLQLKAEEVLAKVPGIASMVVLDPGTGKILVAANSPASEANPNATFGRFAPGSTFKVASSLALMRAGMTPNSTVNCARNVTVNGRVFSNYDDFPSSKVGRISLRDALANSCNTAFIASATKLQGNDLAEAAASLGVGTDYDTGFPAFYGSVPTAGDSVTKGANMIGQGQIEASPLAMAGLAASVQSGRTTIGYLIEGKLPTSTATPLTAAEATNLRSLMTSVVTDGSGRVLRGQVTGAKTGTAEFGTAKPPKTHAWMISWNSTYAIAVMVNEGESGSGTAAPLIKAFLS
ncbi:MAG TPA: penicillin-binding transpeptidase domain-containing protein [Propionibacteriaceae bacterium]|nr:penicillin-binding transpeptidase domain-containing protein [Propionibacteriaceae bacterium]